MLMYHQEKEVITGGYYKISTGKGGVKRYDINGKKKKINERCKALEKEFERRYKKQEVTRKKVLLL